MRRRLFMIWAAIRWLPLMFVMAQGLEAPLVAHSGQPIKPIRVWSGRTSWYGSRFHGRKTASGETFDMYGSTAASPTLPFGSLVRVYNPKTRVGQLVRINDRGPFVDDRELDVSYLVACRLGIRESGVSRLRIELLEVPKRP
jgi:rare lipoprotein A